MELAELLPDVVWHWGGSRVGGVGDAGLLSGCDGTVAVRVASVQWGDGGSLVLGDPCEAGGLAVHLACFRFGVGCEFVCTDPSGFVTVFVEEEVWRVAHR